MSSDKKAFFDSFERIGPEIRHLSIPKDELLRIICQTPEKWELICVGEGMDGLVYFTVRAKES